MYRELGLSSATAGLVLASFAATFLVASMVFGYVSKSRDRRR
jgi:predicted MFS family arabinose efflux permease